MSKVSRKVRRAAGPTAVVVAVIGAFPVAALAAADNTGGRNYITFDARALGAVVDFDVLVPDVLPLKINGGVLSSTAQAKIGPQAFAAAGIAPVPALNSVGIIIPQNVPLLGIPIPQAFQDALKSIDYTKLPAFCQASFPAAPGGSTTNACGGPAQDQAGLGLTATGASGKVVTTGDEDVDTSAAAFASSAGGSAGLTALGASIGEFEATATAGLNKDGIPETDSTATLSGVSFLGGSLKLGALTSETKLASDGTPDGTAGVSSFSIGKASLLGIPIEIGPKGFTIAGTGLADVATVTSLTKQLDSLLGIDGLQIKTFPGMPLTKNGSQVTMASGGVDVSYDLAAPQVNFHARFGFTNGNVSVVQATSATTPPGSAGGATSGSSAGSATGGGTGGTGTSPTVPGAVSDLPVTSSGTDGAGQVPSTVELPPEFPAQAGGGSQQAGDAGILSGVQNVGLSSLSEQKLKNIYFVFMCLALFAGGLRYGSRLVLRGGALAFGPGLVQRLPTFRR